MTNSARRKNESGHYMDKMKLFSEKDMWTITNGDKRKRRMERRNEAAKEEEVKQEGIREEKEEEGIRKNEDDKEQEREGMRMNEMEE